MGILMNRLYKNIDEAKAFALNFTNFVHIYDSVFWGDFIEEPCDACDYWFQSKDYLIPKSNCKKPYGILTTLQFGVSAELKDELIERFDVTEDDFRPIRNKTGEIVFYQITPQHTMLPIYKENGWIPKPPCPKCGRVQYTSVDHLNEKGEWYHYISQEALDDMHDFNITYERLERHYPIYVISRRVYEFLVERYPRTKYFPFFLK